MGYVPSPERLRKGPHPLVHVEGECGYCGPVVPAFVSTALAYWEQAVRDRPEMARRFGPPSWLVSERKKPGEEFTDAHIGLRREYGLDVPIVPTKLSPTGDIVPTGCDDCGMRPRELGRKICSACRKKAQRNR